ncbi:MAG: phage terminase large subunit family protein [Phycisphaerales bacterium]|nr:phage terminase large subunit family protein [Phycisphaerales bacterium]
MAAHNPHNPRNLRPSELCQFLNSTPLGEVISERQLRRHRTRAGLRVASGSDSSRVDLLRYVAWLTQERHRPKPEPDALAGYDAHRERSRARGMALSLSGRDIGAIPEVVDPERKVHACASFRRFCETYFPQTFTMAWSDDHLKVISKIEQAVLEGGLFAMAMPRGSGKTTLCEMACLWAILNGAREFVALIGADEEHAANMLDSIKAELENNESLLADFPEAMYPIRRLEGIHQRTGGQLCLGQQTNIEWTAKEIALPTIPGSKASGAIIRVAGITGRIRGMKHKRADGQSVRPSLVLIDDPQTDESARSPSQCATRELILAGAILGLAGPGKKIAGLMTITVVRPDDMADRLLDREKHPQWQGERTKMVYAFPTNEALWARYAELRAEGLRNDEGTARATAFYREHREAMDAGAIAAWPERFNHDELSAIQHAMNLKLQGEAAFWAEYQNEPLPEVEVDDELLTADQIVLKTNGHNRGVVPADCSHMTMFIDVHANVLYHTVIAWADVFTGYVVSYGTEPDQKRPYFTLRDAKQTLARALPRAGMEARIYAGMERLTEATLAREWRRDDGAMMRINSCLIDANWGESTDVVYRFCRQSQFAGILMPSHGRYIGASSKPMSEQKAKRGDRTGLNWRVPAVRGKRAVRHVTFDTNFWKSFVQQRLVTPMGDPGCLSLWGRKPATHRMIAEHLTAEYRVRTVGRGRTVDEWKLRADANDNHLLDCTVGAAVAASMLGVALTGIGAGTSARARKRLKLSDMQRAR